MRDPDWYPTPSSSHYLVHVPLQISPHIQGLCLFPLSQVYNLLPLQELYGYYFNGLNLEDDSKEPCVPADNIFHNGLYYMPVSSDFAPDVYQYFKASMLEFL